MNCQYRNKIMHKNHFLTGNKLADLHKNSIGILTYVKETPHSVGKCHEVTGGDGSRLGVFV